MSDNRFIITSQHFVEHTSLDAAKQELMRLRQRMPDIRFRIYEVIPGPKSARRNIEDGSKRVDE